AVRAERGTSEDRRHQRSVYHQLSLGWAVSVAGAGVRWSRSGATAARISSICRTQLVKDKAAIWKLVWSETRANSRANNSATRRSLGSLPRAPRRYSLAAFPCKPGCTRTTHAKH